MFRDRAIFKLVTVTVLGLAAIGMLAPQTPRASVASVEGAGDGGLSHASQRFIEDMWAALGSEASARAVPASGVTEEEAIEIALERHAALQGKATSPSPETDTGAYAELVSATQAAEPVEPAEPAAWRVTATSVNLRAGPGTEHEIVGRASLDDPLMPMGDPAGEWIQVETAGGGTAWIFGEFLSPAGG